MKYGSGGTRYGRRALQCALGLDDISKHQVREPEIFEGGTVARLRGERLRQRRNSIVGATRHEQRYREQDQRIGIARRALQYFLARSERRRRPPLAGDRVPDRACGLMRQT